MFLGHYKSFGSFEFICGIDEYYGKNHWTENKEPLLGSATSRKLHLMATMRMNTTLMPFSSSSNDLFQDLNQSLDKRGRFCLFICNLLTRNAEYIFSSKLVDMDVISKELYNITILWDTYHNRKVFFVCYGEREDLRGRHVHMDSGRKGGEISKRNHYWVVPLSSSESDFCLVRVLE